MFSLNLVLPRRDPRGETPRVDPVTLARGLGLVATGLAAGAVGGCLGVGGGTVSMPVLVILYGLPWELAVAASLLSNVAVGAVSAWRYVRHGEVSGGTVARLLPWAAATAGCGVFLGLAWGSDVVEAMFAVFLAGLGAWMLRGGTLRSAADPAPSPGGPVRAAGARVAVIGGAAGLVSGLFGIGGGVLAVPGQRYLLGVPIRRAIANSSFLIVCICLLAAAVQIRVHGARGTFPWAAPFAYAGWMIPGGVAGAVLGVALNRAIPAGILGRVFGAYLVVVGLRMAT